MFVDILSHTRKKRTILNEARLRANILDKPLLIIGEDNKDISFGLFDERISCSANGCPISVSAKNLTLLMRFLDDISDNTCVVFVLSTLSYIPEERVLINILKELDRIATTENLYLFEPAPSSGPMSWLTLNIRNFMLNGSFYRRRIIFSPPEDVKWVDFSSNLSPFTQKLKSILRCGR